MKTLIKKFNLSINYWHPLTKNFETIESVYDPKRKILLVAFKKEQYHFSHKLVLDIKSLQGDIFEYFEKHPYNAPKYIIWTSSDKNIFSLGLDLPSILDFKRHSKTELITEYLQQCLDVCYIQLYSINLPLINITYLQGQAWGAGLAFALLSDIVFCDSKTAFGFSDIKANVFPSFNSFFVLSRVTQNFSIDELLKDVYDSRIEKLLKNHIVDFVIDKDEQYKVGEMIEAIEPTFYTYLSTLKVIKKAHFIDEESVNGFMKLWIYAINGMSEDHIKTIKKLIEQQNRMRSKLHG